MGKASSAKKVARAARAGGSRRPGQRRQLGFPALIVAIVVVGIALVWFARDNREATAAPRSQANADGGDHWHAAFGVYQCSRFLFDGTPEGGAFFSDLQDDPQGIHTHGDGVIHIHPFLDSAGGRNARMQIFFDDIGLQATDSKVTFPDGTVWDESETTCGDDEQAGQIVLAKWNNAQDAADGERPSELITEDFGDVRYRDDREYFTFAFLPEGQFDEIPVRPDVIESLNNLTDVIDPDASTTTTEPATGATTSTTVAGGSTTSAPPADASTTSTTAP